MQLGERANTQTLKEETPYLTSLLAFIPSKMSGDVLASCMHLGHQSTPLLSEEVAKKTEPSFSQWCVVGRQGINCDKRSLDWL